MRIWHQSIVDLSQAPAYEQALTSIAQRVARADTEVVVHGVAPGTYGNHPVATAAKHAYLHHLLETQILDNVRTADAEGYDAFAIVTLQDPALREARTLVDMPVVGYGESAMHLACMLGDRFGIVAFNEPLFPLFESQVSAYRLDGRSVPVVAMDVGYGDLLAAFDDPGDVIEGFEAAARRSIARGADVIIPGQALLGALLTTHDVARIDDVPVLDPLAASIKMAEVMVELRERIALSVTRRGFYYERPPDDLVNHMRHGIRG